VARTPTWKTKDGRIVPIDQMADDHLVFTIAYLKRKFREQAGKDWIPGPGTKCHPSAIVTNQFLEAMHAESLKRWPMGITSGVGWEPGAPSDPDPVDALVVPATQARANRHRRLLKPARVVRWSIDLENDDD